MIVASAFFRKVPLQNFKKCHYKAIHDLLVHKLLGKRFVQLDSNTEIFRLKWSRGKSSALGKERKTEIKRF